MASPAPPGTTPLKRINWWRTWTNCYIFVAKYSYEFITFISFFITHIHDHVECFDPDLGTHFQIKLKKKHVSHISITAQYF